MAKSDSAGRVPERKVITIRDVAQLAGVSMATVSRVLNGSDKVDPQLAKKVQSAAASLKYQPNRAARTLAGSRSMLLGLLVTDIQNTFFTELMRGVEDVSQQNGYLLIICNTAEDARKEQQYIEILAAENVAGAIIVPTQEDPQALELLVERNIPIVVLDRRVRNRLIDAVLIDNVTAAKEAVEHLIANGYRRIGIITGPRSTTTGNERLRGYQQALHEAGIAFDPELELRGPFSIDTGKSLTEKLLGLDQPVDAIFTANNRLTIGALQALYAHGMRVPDNIALVGFDDVQWAIPDLVSITTVTQPTYELGRAAAFRLLQRLQQPDVPRQEIILQHQLLIRESSRPRTHVNLKSV